MESFEEMDKETQEEAMEALLVDKRSKGESTGLTPIDQITVRIPSGMSEKDFLKAIKALLPSKPKGEKHPSCDTCSHWTWEGPQLLRGHCRFYSSTCATQVGHNERPYRYDPKIEKEVITSGI